MQALLILFGLLFVLYPVHADVKANTTTGTRAAKPEPAATDGGSKGPNKECTGNDPASVCDKIISNETDVEGAFQRELSKSLVDLFIGANQYESIKEKLCNTQKSYKKCLFNILTNCGKRVEQRIEKKMRETLLMSKALRRSCNNKYLENKMKSFNVTQCFKPSDNTSAIGATIQATLAGAKEAKCKAAQETAEKLKVVFQDKDDSCKKNITLLIDNLSLLLVRPEHACNAKRGNSRSKERIGAQFVSLNHYLLAFEHVDKKQKEYITCADVDNAENVTMFAWDLIALTCELVSKKDTDVPNTQCRMACIKIMDDEMNEAAAVCINADYSFENETRTIKKGKQKKGGNLNSDVMIKASGRNVLKLLDKNSGTLMIVRRMSYLPQGKTERSHLLTINIRTTKSILEYSSGRLVTPCDKQKTIMQSVSAARRRKRATVSIQAYDVKATGDKEAANFESLALSDAVSAEREDSAFSSATNITPSLLILFSSTAILVASISNNYGR